MIRLSAFLLFSAVALVGCRSPEKPAVNPLPSPRPGASPAQVAGRYGGSYTYGRAFPERAGETVRFVLTLYQAPGSIHVTGTMQEDSWLGGAVRADVVGTCVSEGDVVRLRFTKKYRHSKQPVENFLGSLPPGSSLLTGIWFDAESSTGSGTFQLDGFQPR